MPPSSSCARWARPSARSTSSASSRPTSSPPSTAADAGAPAARLAALQAGALDWDLVLDEAVRHGLIPLLYRHTLALHAPGAALDRLEREFAAATLRSLALTDALVDVITAMRAAGVGVTPFEGPALAASIYGDVRLRRFDDLDILVHRADAAAADAVLARRGYRACAASSWTRRYGRGDVAVALHWAIAPGAG
ncbi:MAG TPA: nucleotidyltransferase family protein, partial [Methylomirabilota bacterium]|nr:nucleotidyltransferase family protein [Methylomirabilota bacterium]